MQRRERPCESKKEPTNEETYKGDDAETGRKGGSNNAKCYNNCQDDFQK